MDLELLCEQSVIGESFGEGVLDYCSLSCTFRPYDVVEGLGTAVYHDYPSSFGSSALSVFDVNRERDTRRDMNITFDSDIGERLDVYEGRYGMTSADFYEGWLAGKKDFPEANEWASQYFLYKEVED